MALSAEQAIREIRHVLESFIQRKKRAFIAIVNKIPMATYFIIKDKVGYYELEEDYLNNSRKDNLAATIRNNCKSYSQISISIRR